MLTGPRRRPAARADAGHTVVELSIAILVTTVVLVAVATGLALLIRAYTQVQDHSLASDRGRVLVDRLDRDLRWTSSVNLPVRTGDVSHLEYQSNVTAAGAAARCTQWRFDAAADTLQVRTWAVVDTTEPAWDTVLTGVANDPGTQPVFAVTAATTTEIRQQVAVRLQVTLPRGDATTTALLTARNSSTASPSNLDLDLDGRSDTEVCTTFGRP